MLKILEKLKSLPSNNDKKSFLSSLVGTEEGRLFVKVASLALDNKYVFNIKSKIPKEKDIKRNEETLTATLEHLLDWLSDFESLGGFKSNSDIAILTKAMASTSVENAEVIRRILKRNLGCGVSTSIVNEVFPGAIFDPPYMRRKSLSEKTKKHLKYPCAAQTKMDGKYTNIIIDRTNSKVDFRSREWELSTEKVGKPEYNTEDFMKHVGGDYVLHGEMVVVDENDPTVILPRTIGNGYLNRDDIDVSRVRFVVWDIVTFDNFFDGTESAPYATRLAVLTELVKDLNASGFGAFTVCETEICHSFEDVVKYYTKMRKQGQEGAIVKNLDAKWYDTSSGTNFELKIKQVLDCDVMVVGWEYGTEKYENAVGAIRVVSSDGVVDCWVGTGLSDDLRFNIPRIQGAVDSVEIVCVRYNDVVENVDKPGKLALYCPRFVEFPEGRLDADTSTKIVEQLETINI